MGELIGDAREEADRSARILLYYGDAGLPAERAGAGGAVPLSDLGMRELVNHKLVGAVAPDAPLSGFGG
jgi:hypothetical protein